MRLALLTSAAVLLVGPATASAFDPAVEALNFSKIHERERT